MMLRTLDETTVKRKLHDLGHLERPFGVEAGFWPVEDVDKMSMETPEVTEGIRSYQSMFGPTAEAFGLPQRYHPDRSSTMIVADGDVGPVTEDLLILPRCGEPDYGRSAYDPTDLDVSEAVGTGNWAGCHGVDGYHSCKVKVTTNLPSFMSKATFDEVWARVVDAYAEAGLLFQLTTGNDHNTTMEFVVPSGGWIGLAIVGSGRLSCSSRIWSRYSVNYRPADVVTQWTTLIKHELGHNCGMDHSNGGVMNPYILNGLPVSWRNDPHWPQLVRWFGGVPVPRGPDVPVPKERSVVVAYKYPDGKYEDLLVLPPGQGAPFFPT